MCITVAHSNTLTLSVLYRRAKRGIRIPHKYDDFVPSESIVNELITPSEEMEIPLSITPEDIPREF